MLSRPDRRSPAQSRWATALPCGSSGALSSDSGGSKCRTQSHKSQRRSNLIALLCRQAPTLGHQRTTLPCGDGEAGSWTPWQTRFLSPDRIAPRKQAQRLFCQLHPPPEPDRLPARSRYVQSSLQISCPALPRSLCEAVILQWKTANYQIPGIRNGRRNRR